MKVRPPGHSGGVHRGPALFTLLLLAACQPVPVNDLTATDESAVARWADWFTDGEAVPLQFPEGGPDLLRISELTILPNGDIVVPDGGGRRVLLFEPDGALRRSIALGEGEALELTVLGALAAGLEGELYLVDPAGNRVSVLRPDDFMLDRKFSIASSAAALVPLGDGSFVTYAPGERKVFQRFDPEGKRLASRHRIEDEKLRIFHARIQNGGIAKTPTGAIFGIHPGAYEIVRLSETLKILEIWRAGEDDPVQPHPPAFPDRLSPYEYDPRHEKWWAGFDHIADIHALGEDQLLVSVSRGDPGSGSVQFVNLYRTDGTVTALGLDVPHRGRLVAAGDRDVYVARNARLRKDGVVEPLALYRHRMRATAR